MLKRIEEGEFTLTRLPDNVVLHGQEYMVFHYEQPNVIATVYKPVLTPEEYERRRAALEVACAKVLREVEENKARAARAQGGTNK